MYINNDTYYIMANSNNITGSIMDKYIDEYIDVSIDDNGLNLDELIHNRVNSFLQLKIKNKISTTMSNLSSDIFCKHDSEEELDSEEESDNDSVNNQIVNNEISDIKAIVNDLTKKYNNVIKQNELLTNEIENLINMQKESDKLIKSHEELLRLLLINNKSRLDRYFTRTRNDERYLNKQYKDIYCNATNETIIYLFKHDFIPMRALIVLTTEHIEAICEYIKENDTPNKNHKYPMAIELFGKFYYCEPNIDSKLSNFMMIVVKHGLIGVDYINDKISQYNKRIDSCSTDYNPLPVLSKCKELLIK